MSVQVSGWRSVDINPAGSEALSPKGRRFARISPAAGREPVCRCTFR